MPLRVVYDRGRELVFAHPPRRVVSLVPSDTSSLLALGARDRLVGRTRYCDAPEDVPLVGGTKDLDVDEVSRLAPDLIVANQEENSRKHLEELARRGFAILISFPRTVAQGIAHLARLARILDAERHDLVRRGYEALQEAESGRKGVPPLRAFVPIWMDPLMTVNAHTFTSDALRVAGAENVFADRDRRYPLAADLGQAIPTEAGTRDTRYPRVSIDEVVHRAPEIVLLPDEPHPFTERDAEVFRRLELPASRRDAVVLCSGRDLMWYGAQSVEVMPRVRALVDSLR